MTWTAVRREEAALGDLIVKLAYTVPRFTTDWVGKQLHLSSSLVGHLLSKVCYEGQVEAGLWQTSTTSSHYIDHAPGPRARRSG